MNEYKTFPDPRLKGPGSVELLPYYFFQNFTRFLKFVSTK